MVAHKLASRSPQLTETTDGIDWVDCLPLAAACISADAEGGPPVILRQNSAFADTLRQSGNGCLPDALGSAGSEVAARRIARAHFDWSEPTPGGRCFDVDIAPIPGRAAHELLVTLTDRTPLIRSQATLRRELATDSLTGLSNRLGFSDEMERRLRAHRSGDPGLTLLVIDLARFSRVNESIGALAGDELLLTVARRLVQRVRTVDHVARVGGDEFAVLAVNSDGERGARIIADRIAELFDEPFRIGDLRITVEAAIGGIATLPQCAESNDIDAAELLRQAQIALKQAKRGGEISFYEPTASAGLYQRFGRETALRRAIEQGELDLAFQPLVAMHDRRIVGFEALARWTHAGRPVPPGEFVPIAEDSGLIIPMGRLVLHRAMEMLGEWDERAGFIIPAYVSVNVSPLQFERDDVAAVLADASARTGVSASRMVIEITESCVVRRPDHADVVLRSVTEQGARIAMDDFGTGYSNIASLQRLPIDTLKIDRSLVAGIDSSMDSLAIVRTIQRLAEALNIRTIAEGIETETVAQKVSAIGCDVGQGYLFAKPLTGDAAFEAWQRGAAR